MASESTIRAQSAARALAEARTSGRLLTALEENTAPQSLEEAYAVHAEMAKLLGPIGGWKVGAGSPEATPMFAPMPLRWLNTAALRPGTTAEISQHRLRGVEAEIAFHLGGNLPPRAEKYSRQEIIAAIASCHPAIEVLESAYIDPGAVEKFSQIADLQSNGGFVPGPAVAGRQRIDFAQEAVEVSVNGEVEVSRVASNSAGTDLLRLMEWLANVGTVSYGGLKAGDWVTTGSWTGKTVCPVGADVTAAFTTAGSVMLKFV